MLRRSALNTLWMRLQAQLRLFGDTGRPTQAHISPTDRCNLKCVQCDIWKIRPSDELSTGDWKRILDELADLAGPISVNFAGGEPFVRKDIPDLIEYGARAGFTVSANTNGTLIDAVMARRLHDSGLDILYVSLDGGLAETHDRLRGRPGTFRQVLGALDSMAHYSRPKVVVAAILSRYSLPELPDLLELVMSRNLQIVFQPLYQTFGQPYNPGWYRDSPLLPDDLDAVDRQLDALIALKREDGPICNDVKQLAAFKRYFRGPTLPNGLTCKAGFRDLALDPYGHMLVCYHLFPVGNVRAKSLKSLWWSREAALLRQEVVGCPRTCNLQNCNFDSEAPTSTTSS